MIFFVPKEVFGERLEGAFNVLVDSFNDLLPNATTFYPNVL
jgi:hypothetical protein